MIAMTENAYPRATREIGELRRQLAPEIHRAFDEFSKHADRPASGGL